MAQPLTFEQIRDVRDQLRQPLSGRPVLVPLGTKAFVPGFLQPDKVGEDEMVTFVPVNVDEDNGAIISRKQALDRLQEEMDQVSNRKKAPPVLPKQTHSTSQMNTNALPYFEIREEIDSTGKQVKAEAIDVSRHLEYLRQHPEVVQEETLPPALTGSSTASEPVEEIPVTDLKPLSEGEYDVLAARLEELARLEEAGAEEPVPKVMKKSNHKMTSSSGWSKGFLNNSTKKTKPVADKKVVSGGAERLENSNKPTDQLQKDAVNAEPVPSKHISKSVFSGVIQEHGGLDKPKSNKVPVETSSPRVRFGDEQNEIREIPRIGETPVASIARNPSRPIVGAGNWRPESQLQQEEVPKKKLSRFAMERQQLNR